MIKRFLTYLNIDAHNQATRLILNNGAWILIEKFLRATLGLIVGAWVARYLGPRYFGNLAYILAYIAFFQGIVTLGLDGIVVRNISQNKEKAGEILGTVFCLRFFMGCICWIVAVLLSANNNHADDQDTVFLTAIIGSSIIFQAADTIDLWFQSQSQSKRTIYAKLAAHLIANGLKIVMIFFKMTITAFAIVSALDSLITSVGLILAYKYFRTDSSWIFIKQTGIALLRESWPYIASCLSIAIYMRIDQIMIGNLLGSSDLGLYAVAIPLSQVWLVIPMALIASLAPQVTRKKALGLLAYYDYLLKIFRIFGVISIIISIIIYLTSDLLVNLIYGEAYKLSGQILAIHIFSTFFIYQSLAQNLWIINESKGLIQTYQTILGALTALVTNYFLIPILGVNGAAYSSVISIAIAGVLSNLLLAPEIFKMQFGFRSSFKY